MPRSGCSRATGPIDVTRPPAFPARRPRASDRLTLVTAPARRRLAGCSGRTLRELARPDPGAGPAATVLRSGSEGAGAAPPCRSRLELGSRPHGPARGNRAGSQALRALGGRRAAAADQTPCERGIRPRGAGGHGRLPVRPMGGAARAGGSRCAAGDVLRWLRRGLRDFFHPRLPAVPRPGNQRARSGKVASGGTAGQSRTLRDQCGRLGGARGG